MQNYFFKRALLPDGWQSNVAVNINDEGLFTDVTYNAVPSDNAMCLECVIPAMPNCHSHVFQRAMAGLTEFKTSKNDSFWSWRKLMYQYANKINSSHLYDIARYCYSQMLASGYTSVCEFHYIHRDINDKNLTDKMSLSLINAANDVGISLTLLPVLYQSAHIDGTQLNAQQQRFYLSTSEYLKLYGSLKKQLHKNQNMGICFHSLRAVDIKQMQKVIEQLGSQQPIHIHISEQTGEVEQLINYTNQRPVEYLFHNLSIDHNWNLVHATHLNAREIEMIAKSQAKAVICPMTEANLGDGIFPLAQYIKCDGRFCIGSDSHILINPFQEMQILEYSQRLKAQQRIIASTNDSPHVGTLLWNESVKSGAQSCQLPVAGIQEKQWAHFLSIDTDHAMLTSLSGEQILDTIVFANNKIETVTYIKGKKYLPIDKNIVQNYKNTLKLLR